MKIGIITPVYNGEKTIFSTIISAHNAILNITESVTHYIYNDGSSDFTDIIINNILNNKKIKYFKETINRGQSYSRNFLIKEAIKDGCTHLAFLDSDDVWLKNHLSDNLIFLKEYDIIYNTPKFINEKNEEVFPNFPIPDIFIGKHLEHNNFIWISSVIGKIECFINNFFDSNLDSLEDYDIWLRLYRQGYSFKNTNTKTINYLVLPTSEASKGINKIELFKQKNKPILNKLNLHLACGEDYQNDYINIDLYPTEKAKIDAKFDVSKIPYPDNSVDTIRALHIIEHFSFNEGNKILKEWNRVLKPGGKLIIETPDLFATCKKFIECDDQFRLNLYGHFFAFPDLPGQTHKFLFTEQQLVCQLGWAGFKNMTRVQPMSNYVSRDTIELFLAMEAYK